MKGTRASKGHRIAYFLNLTAITVVTVVCVAGTVGLFWGLGWAISKRFF